MSLILWRLDSGTGPSPAGSAPRTSDSVLAVLALPAEFVRGCGALSVLAGTQVPQNWIPAYAGMTALKMIGGQ